MKKIAGYSLSLVLLLGVLVSCNKAADTPPTDVTTVAEQQQEQRLISAEVVNVVDGDTIDIRMKSGKKERVRFILVDTPETVHPKKGEEPFGCEVSNFTKKTLSGQKVDLRLGVQERDRYGRLLAYVYLKDGTMINELLLQKGLARVAVFPPNTEFIDQFRDIENKAKKEHKGIWSQ
ncbi:thermonuclease family protein [Bacillus sp. WMMC1349]|uniref:thermonuclease family protein n=1 Tax=Bacillus sp. WMMC1349 TaxID=2736254 RepID=UPI001553AF84|nr:thermonuclease family protein [Bacillus sp. WMMC1349]NPC90838.1 thermonuclease family protein [Bacillus sp. WMMC1349]NPC90862.1 thermonuclease family protein [Bacillus sp. WMMC1349]NPC90894.1 thermonuclease family protein [Bacillus sp. WMMC1349]NPC90907.1 thermonuclease family protein [Bacillus sp. WMMC1349]NPC90931.1 thermonuclease family protein [Bacillus sp. WMMC1349]